MEAERIRVLNDRAIDKNGSYVLYWMQQSQRARFNPALEYAIRQADDLNLGVVVGFGLMPDYPEANRRHFAFMLEGLAETAATLGDRGIQWVGRRGEPDRVALDLARQAAAVVCDRGYLRHQRRWRRRVAAEAGKRVVQVEGDCVVPVEVASDKREYAARTLRPKINKLRKDFIKSLSEKTPRKSSLSLDLANDIDPRQTERILEQISAMITASTAPNGLWAAQRKPDDASNGLLPRTWKVTAKDETTPVLPGLPS